MEKKEILLDLINFYKSMLKQYNILADLEINDKVNSKEYKDALNNIRLIRDLVNKKIDDLDLSGKEIYDFQNFLSYELGLSDNYDKVSDILSLNEDNLDGKRLLSQLSNYSYVKHKAVVVDVDKDEILEGTFDDLVDQDNDFIVEDLLFYNTLMDYILLAIKKETNLKMKKILIKIKYRLIFVTEYLEEQFLINPLNFTRSNMYQQMYLNILNKIETLEDDEVKDENVTILDSDDFEYDFEDYSDLDAPTLKIIEEELDNLANIKDEELRSFTNQAKAYLKVIYIKTLMSIVYDKDKISKIINIVDLDNQKCLKYIDEAYNTDDRLSLVKKVDL